MFFYRLKNQKFKNKISRHEILRFQEKMKKMFKIIEKGFIIFILIKKLYVRIIITWEALVQQTHHLKPFTFAIVAFPPFT